MVKFCLKCKNAFWGGSFVQNVKGKLNCSMPLCQKIKNTFPTLILMCVQNIMPVVQCCFPVLDSSWRFHLVHSFFYGEFLVAIT